MTLLNALVGALIGTVLGEIAYHESQHRLTKRRSAELERRVAAELLSRGVSFNRIMLEQIAGPTPSPVTEELVQKISDRVEGFMRITDELP